MAEYYAGADMNITPMAAPELRKGLDDWLEDGARALQQNFSEVLKFIQALVENAYFERVWTMQETALAWCTHLETPGGIIYGWEIDEAVRRACGIRSYPRSPDDPPTYRDTKASFDLGVGQIDNRVVLFDNRHIRGGVSTQAWIARNRRPLALVWRIAQNRRCTVAKDALWGMMAMVEGGDSIQTTYEQPVAQVLEELVEKGLLRLEILCVRKTIASPSWVPALENEVPLMGAECTIEPARRKVTIRNGSTEMRAKKVIATDVKGDYYVRIADTERSQEIVMMTEGWDFESNNLPGRRHWLILIEGTDSRVTFLLISDQNESGNVIHKVDALQCGLELPAEAVPWVLDGQVDIRIE
ncbi:hypothetical protein GQ607_004010 [Colletotrichum asianum]|uniref:Heterokaryon incompatibility domain-containing protein n=1 Tax=Colletotrichum asianum TaxID=702518 RepID=A0A8H3ZR14_9PEZI|nr:hypothetical protein GQ607_004010 [Colletotrichum asianum]